MDGIAREEERMRRAPLRFLSPQRLRVRAPLAATVAAMAAFGKVATKPGEGHSEVLSREGNVYRIRFTSYAGRRRYVTEEEVIVYPPDIITYRHLTGPLDDVYEVFTARPQSDAVTVVNYMGQYRNKRFDWPVLGWLIHRFVVLPRYDPLIANHLADVKRRAEGGT
jgi:hypothetical protein